MPRDEGQHLPQPLPAPSQSPKSQRRHRETPKLLNPPSIPPWQHPQGQAPHLLLWHLPRQGPGLQPLERTVPSPTPGQRVQETP